jgi:hypothetical protein
MLRLKADLSMVIEKSEIVIEDVKVNYLRDEDYLFLSTNKEARIAFLNELGVKECIVERLGVEIEPNKFKRKEVKLEMPIYQADREMGYYHRI